MTTTAIPSQYALPAANLAYEPPVTRDTMRAALASEWTRDRLATIAAASPRARQAKAGPSEIGQECPRRLSYRIAGTPIVNLPDPLKAMFGTGMHVVIAAGLDRVIDGGNTGRYLVEHQTTYRGVTGTVDLHDRFPKRMSDWKTTTKERIRKYQNDGPPTNYVVQAQIYAAGLMTEGETVDVIALVFIPRDGVLRDVWTWTTEPDQAIADKWIDRYEEIAAQTEAGGPAVVRPVPSNMCAYCPNYRPNAAELAVACPGTED